MSDGRTGFEPVSVELSRRTLLRGALLGGVGLGAAALIGCDDDDDEEPGGGTEATATSSDGESTATEEAMDEGEGAGQLIQDPDLPFPYEFPEPAAEPKRGGTFIHATNFTNSVADPAVNVTGGTDIVISAVYDKLLGYKMGPEADTTKVELVPELATDWEVAEDGLTYTFQIREGVTWQNVSPVDGRAFEAEDVKYSYERYQDGSIQSQRFTAMSSIEAVSPSELRITLNEPLVDFVIPLAGRLLDIIPRELVDDGSIERTAVGTGPMVLKELIDQQEVNFERNPDYWREMYVDALQIRMIPDLAARVAAFRVGQIDQASNMLPTVQDAMNLLETNPDTQITMSRVTGAVHALAMNPANPKLSDDRVRQGLALAVDRETMIDVVYDGYARAHGMIPWVFPFDTEPSGDQLGKYMHFDPDEARKLLSAAGAEGLQLEDRHFNYLANWGAVGEILVQQLADVGVTVDLVADDYNTYTTLWVGGNLEEVTHTAWGGGGPMADGYTYDQLHSESPGNRWKINDPVFDDLTIRQRVEHDPDARRELLKQIYDHDMDKMYRLPMPGYHTIEGMQPWVRNLRFGGAVGTSAGNHDWAEQINTLWLDK